MVAYNLQKSIVLVGLMGSGKSSIGKRLSEQISISFVDSDDEIELAAGMPISEIFDKFGESYFRAGEERVLERLLGGEPKIIATGGGSFISNQIRHNIRLKGFSVWLKADFETLWSRVQGKATRPLLQNPNPDLVLKRLIMERDPVYEMADLVVHSKKKMTHQRMVLKLIKLLKNCNVLECIDDG